MKEHTDTLPAALRRTLEDERATIVRLRELLEYIRDEYDNEDQLGAETLGRIEGELDDG